MSEPLPKLLFVNFEVGTEHSPGPRAFPKLLSVSFEVQPVHHETFESGTIQIHQSTNWSGRDAGR